MHTRPSFVAPASRVASIFVHFTALLAMGVMAGFFWAYSVNVAPAMLDFDGPTYAMAQSALNRHVRHSLFFAFFFGPPLLCTLTLATAWRKRRDGWWRALAAAGMLYALGIVFFTQQVNLPLNVYTESWQPGSLPIDWAETRADWNAANLCRTVAAGVAFMLAAASLYLRGTR